MTNILVERLSTISCSQMNDDDDGSNGGACLHRNRMEPW
jgi:hypothetical protein